MSPLLDEANDYLRLRRALGHNLDEAHRLLLDFGRSFEPYWDPETATATSSASISTTLHLAPSSASQVWLWIGALTILPPQGLRDKKQTLCKRCAVSGLRMGVTYVFLRVWCNTFILIETRGRSSVGRAPALQVDKPKRCAFMYFRRSSMSAVAGIMR